MKKITAWIIAHDWIAIPLIMLAAILVVFLIGLWLKLMIVAFKLGYNLL